MKKILTITGIVGLIAVVIGLFVKRNKEELQ